jgi:hypothetical protein
MCHENFALLGSFAASSGNSLPKFRENRSVTSSRVRYVLSRNLEDGTDRVSRRVGKKLPLLAAKESRRAKFSSTSWRKLEMTLGNTVAFVLSMRNGSVDHLAYMTRGVKQAGSESDQSPRAKCRD